jgi:hypothetical protein
MMERRRITGLLFLAAAVAFAVASSVLAAAFDWPDVLREPAGTVLARFTAGGERLVWIWFATAWAYGLLALPILLLPGLRTLGVVGAASVLLSPIGFLRWVFVVPPPADAWTAAGPAARLAIEAVWTAQHQFGGALLGEHLGQVLAIGWSAGMSVVALRGELLPRPLGVTGLAASALYLLNQGDVLATALPGFPVWDAAGLLGSTAWGLWIAALGAVLLTRAHRPAGGSVAPSPA